MVRLSELPVVKMSTIETNARRLFTQCVLLVRGLVRSGDIKVRKDYVFLADGSLMRSI